MPVANLQGVKKRRVMHCLSAEAHTHGKKSPLAEDVVGRQAQGNSAVVHVAAAYSKTVCVRHNANAAKQTCLAHCCQL
jgi:hypothetical protein